MPLQILLLYFNYPLLKGKQNLNNYYSFRVDESYVGILSYGENKQHHLKSKSGNFKIELEKWPSFGINLRKTNVNLLIDGKEIINETHESILSLSLKSKE